METIVGTSGVDSITLLTGTKVLGSVGADVFTASSGTDTFVYSANNQSNATVGGADTITGFAGGGVDKFDFSSITSNGTIHYLGVGTVTTVPFTSPMNGGEARLITTGATTATLQIDLDGNGSLDMQVNLVGLNGTLSQANFV